MAAYTSSMMTSPMAILPSTRSLSSAPITRIPTKTSQCFKVHESLSVKEHAVAAAAMITMLVIPEIAEASLSTERSETTHRWQIAHSFVLLYALFQGLVFAGFVHFTEMKSLCAAEENDMIDRRSEGLRFWIMKLIACFRSRSWNRTCCH